MLQRILLLGFYLSVTAVVALGVPPSAAPESSSIPPMVAAQDRERILKAADAALTLKPLSITDDRSPLSEGGPNDFFSMSDYFWPNPSKPDGKPWIARDGQSNPDNFNKHRETLMALRDATAALAAAYRLTGDERYAAKAADFWKVFFVDPATRMNPRLDYAQVIIGKATPTRGIGLIDTLHLVEVPLAIRAIEGSESLKPDLLAGLKQWFTDYTEWLTTNPKGKDEGSQSNNHAVAYWLQVVSFATFTGNEKLLAEGRRQFKEAFIGMQLGPDGSFPWETRRTKPYAYSIFQLDNMASLAQLLSTPTDNLWTYQRPDGLGLRQAMTWLYPYLEDKRKWPFSPDVQAWEGWPTRQSCLLLGGAALGEEKYLKLWRKLKPDPQNFEIRRNNAITRPLLWLPTPTAKKLNAGDVFQNNPRLRFADNFQDAKLTHWDFSEDDRYNLPAVSPSHIQVVDAPKLSAGKKAVRFVVERAPGSFRSEISLPHEDGWQERWYAARIFVPEDWVTDPSKAQDIFLQWHGIPGNWKPTYPNLSIAIKGDTWVIQQNFGSPQKGPTRKTQVLSDPVKRGEWISWIIHARWSPNDDGLVAIWKDGRSVYQKSGPSVYGTIGVEYTPYLKTGIYHPEWHTDTPEKLRRFQNEQAPVKRKVIYLSELKVGGPQAGLEDFLESHPADQQ